MVSDHRHDGIHIRVPSSGFSVLAGERLQAREGAWACVCESEAAGTVPPCFSPLLFVLAIGAEACNARWPCASQQICSRVLMSMGHRLA